MKRTTISLSSFGPCQLLESTNGQLNEQLSCGIVLLARFQEDDSRAKRFICIEKLDDGLYAVQQVPSNVVSTCATEEMQTIPDSWMQPRIIDFDGDDWWHPFEIKEPVIQSAKLSMMLELGPQPVKPIEYTLDRMSTVDDLLEHLGTIYLETLYTSKASLVFFVKSTIIKLRLKLVDQGLSCNDFSATLQAKLMPNFAKLDWKYKHLLPQMIRSTVRDKPDVEVLGMADLEALRSGEESFARTWIESCVQASGNSGSTDAIFATSIDQLKTREYQMIILVLLESLALCHSDSENKDVDEHGAQLLPANQQSPEVLIDVLIDRLSISQSLDFTGHNDVLRSFCVEVICPFYSSKLPELTRLLLQKCVPQDLYSFGDKSSRTKVSKSDRATSKGFPSTTSRSASLKRVQSAPANLLTEKKVVPKKRSLGREVSMSKRAPSIELKHTKVLVPKRVVSFEERRRQRLEKEEQDRVQVGRTPAKPRKQDFQEALQPGFIPQLAIHENSKASFMAVGETPSKGNRECAIGIAETPAASRQTPIRGLGRTTEAPTHGVQDTPSGKGILFKLDSPSGSFSARLSERGYSNRGTSLMSSPITTSPPRLPNLKKSVTFSGAGRKESSVNPFNDHLDSFDADDAVRNKGQTRLFDREITLRKGGNNDPSSSHHDQEGESDQQQDEISATELRRSQTLEDVLDWL